jgi:sulfur carrier protein
MTIKVNGESYQCQDGISIEGLMNEKNFIFPLKTVFVNGKRIPKGEHPTTLLKDGDDVQVVHMMSGG